MSSLVTALRRRWPLALAAYLGIWTVPGLVSSSQLMMSYSLRGEEPPLSLVLRLALPGWYVWALLAPIVFMGALRFPLEGPHLWRRLPVHLALNTLLAGIWVGLIVAARRGFGLPGQTDVRLQLVSAIGTSLLTYWAIVLVVHAARYHQDGKARALRAAELSAQLSSARLSALQGQLQPHFLFNTMHAISAKVRGEPDRAESMLAGLADLLRRVLEVSDDPLVPLAREVEFLERYLAIQRLRFGDRLKAELTVEDEAATWPVPCLLLQPLVENAVEHGIASRRSGGRLEVRAGVTDGRLHLWVRDDGPGLEDAALEPGAWGVGLGNTRDRLRQLYGDGHRFEVRNHPEGGVEVHVEVPAGAAEAVDR